MTVQSDNPARAELEAEFQSFQDRLTEMAREDLHSLPMTSGYLGRLSGTERAEAEQRALGVLARVMELEIAGQAVLFQESDAAYDTLRYTHERSHEIARQTSSMISPLAQGAAEGAVAENTLAQVGVAVLDGVQLAKSLIEDAARASNEGDIVSLGELRDTIVYHALQGAQEAQEVGWIERVSLWIGALLDSIVAWDFSALDNVEAEVSAQQAERMGQAQRRAVAEGLIESQLERPADERFSDGIAYEIAEKVIGVDEMGRMQRMNPGIPPNHPHLDVMMSRVAHNNERYPSDGFQSGEDLETLWDSIYAMGEGIVTEADMPTRVASAFTAVLALRVIPGVGDAVHALDPTRHAAPMLARIRRSGAEALYRRATARAVEQARIAVDTEINTFRTNADREIAEVRQNYAPRILGAGIDSEAGRTLTRQRDERIGTIETRRDEQIAERRAWLTAFEQSAESQRRGIEAGRTPSASETDRISDPAARRILTNLQSEITRLREDAQRHPRRFGERARDYFRTAPATAARFAVALELSLMAYDAVPMEWLGVGSAQAAQPGDEEVAAAIAGAQLPFESLCFARSNVSAESMLLDDIAELVRLHGGEVDCDETQPPSSPPPRHVVDPYGMLVGGP